MKNKLKIYKNLKLYFFKNIFGIFITLIFFLLFFIPLLILGIDHFHYSLFKKIFEKKTIIILTNSLTQSFLSVIISIIIGIPIVIYTKRFNNFLTKLISLTIFIPFFFPSVATGIAISQLLRNTNLNYTLYSILIAHIFYNSPIIIKYLSESLKNIDNTLIDSAKIDGASNIQIFFYIILYQIKDGALRGIFLAFVYCFTSFAVILSVGNIKYSSFETSIYTSMFGKFDIKEAFFYAIFQFFILSFINILFFQKEKFQILKNYEINYTKKDQFNIFIIFVILYLLFEYGIILNSILNSFINQITNSFDLTIFMRVFSKDFNKNFPVINSIFNSIILSFIVSIISIIFSILLLENRNKFSDYAILLTFGFSTTFIAIMLYYLYIKFDFNLIILAIIGLSLITIPVAYSFLYDNFINFDTNIINLSKIDGCGSIKSFFYIKYPLLKNLILITFFQIFTIVYGEFTLVFSMKINNLLPLASVTNYLISDKRLFMESNMFNSINILIVILIFILSLIFSKNKKYY